MPGSLQFPHLLKLHESFVGCIGLRFLQPILSPPLSRIYFDAFKLIVPWLARCTSSANSRPICQKR